jgi:regulator of protease activity HflC (stomatin/prohibitin superfamily)
MFRTLLMIVAVGAFALVGCRRGDISIDRQAGTINVTLSESDVNAAIEAALSAAANPLLRNPSVDLQNGTIVVSGEHLRRDGSGQTVSGSLTFSPTVANNQLSISVTAVDIEGVTLDDADAQDFANRIAERINAAIARTARVLEVSSLTVSDTGIEFALKRAD